MFKAWSTHISKGGYIVIAKKLKFIYFFPETQGRFQPNFAQSFLGERNFKFVPRGTTISQLFLMAVNGEIMKILQNQIEWPILT